MKKILSFIICVLMVVSIGTLTSCKKKVNNETSWQVNVYGADEEEIITQQVGFSISSSKTIKEIWVKVDAIVGEEVKITYQRYTTGTTDAGTPSIKPTASGMATASITAKKVKTAKKETNGWINLTSVNGDWNQSTSKVLLSLTGNITIDEVTFFDKDGKRVEGITLDRANIVIEEENMPISNMVYTKAEIEAFAGYKYGLPTNLLNNQEAFDNKNK